MQRRYCPNVAPLRAISPMETSRWNYSQVRSNKSMKVPGANNNIIKTVLFKLTKDNLEDRDIPIGIGAWKDSRI